MAVFSGRGHGLEGLFPTSRKQLGAWICTLAWYFVCDLRFCFDAWAMYQAIADHTLAAKGQNDIYLAWEALEDCEPDLLQADRLERVLRTVPSLQVREPTQQRVSNFLSSHTLRNRQN